MSKQDLSQERSQPRAGGSVIIAEAVMQRPWSIGGVNQYRGVGIFTVPDYQNQFAGGPSCKHVMWVPTQQEAERVIAEHNAALPR